jgi:hypothetical protein
VKIRATCRNCGREVFVQQVVDSAGHCTWCGKAFNKDYAAILIRAMQQSEEAGTVLQDGLEHLADMGNAGLDIDEESVLQPLRHALKTIHEQGRARV